MRKLTKSRKNSVISGVCGGLGAYFNIDPIIIRIAWVFSLIPFFFNSAVIYVVCSIIIPEDDGVIYQDEDEAEVNVNGNSSLLVGGMLVLLGLFFLAREFFPEFMNIVRLWPALLIVAGIYIIFNKRD